MGEKDSGKDGSLLNTTNNNKMESKSSKNNESSRGKIDYRPWGMCAFVANVSIVFLLSFTQGVYTIGVVRTIERRFGLSSKKTGLMMSVGDIAHIIIVTFVGYFGNKTHKPRFISANILFGIVAGFLMALPYFLYSKDPIAYSIDANYTTLDKPINSLCGNGWEGGEDCDRDNEQEVSENENAYYIFILAQILQGIGGAGISTLSLAYVDENVNKESSSLYIGIFTSVFGIGPIFGLLLGAVCTSLPENLKSSNVPPNDPNFIGAWWLGYVLCAAGTAIASIPLYFFPKYQPQRKAPKADQKLTLVEQIKAYPSSLWSLVTNKAYVCLLGCYVLSMYIVPGVYINIPRFLEIHFFQPPFIANVVAAMPALAGVIGGVLGGVIMSRTRLKPPGSALFIVSSLVVSIIGLVIISFLDCPQLQMDGVVDRHGSISVETPCNRNCSCLTDQEHYRPVCGSNDVTYFSACHAGCDVIQNGTYSDCMCVDGEGSARPGVCLDSCSMIYPFAMVLLTSSLVSSISRVPGTIIQFRVVKEDEKGFAISFTSFIVNLMVFIPGPVLFGAMIDASCLLWQKTCDTIGSCLLFDTSMFRYVTYSVSAGLQAVGLVFGIMLYLIVRNRDYTDTEEETVELEKPIEESVPLKSDQ